VDEQGSGAISALVLTIAQPHTWPLTLIIAPDRCDAREQRERATRPERGTGPPRGRVQGSPRGEASRREMNWAFASSKISLRTQLTYSGEKGIFYKDSISRTSASCIAEKRLPNTGTSSPTVVRRISGVFGTIRDATSRTGSSS
jgi:hypothetical protein